jgi:hypothetical protein
VAGWNPYAAWLLRAELLNLRSTLEHLEAALSRHARAPSPGAPVEIEETLVLEDFLVAYA